MDVARHRDRQGRTSKDVDPDIVRQDIRLSGLPVTTSELSEENGELVGHGARFGGVIFVASILLTPKTSVCSLAVSRLKDAVTICA